jgi:hypothetical protein
MSLLPRLICSDLEQSFRSTERTGYRRSWAGLSMLQAGRLTDAACLARLTRTQVRARRFVSCASLWSASWTLRARARLTVAVPLLGSS